MNRKGTSKSCRMYNLLLKSGALLLAAIMLFGNLTLPGGVVAASAEETAVPPAVYWSEDFEGFTLTDGKATLPGTYTNVGSCFSVVQDPNNAENQVLQMKKEGSLANVLKTPKMNPIPSKAVLEYDFYFPSGCGTLYPLSLSNQSSSWGVQLAIEGDGDVRHNSDPVDTSYTKIKADDWHSLKLVADAENHVWYLWVNDAHVFTGVLADTVTGFQALVGGALTGSNVPGLLYDNIRITELIPATGFALTEQEATLNVGEFKQLSWSFTPATASLDAVIFTSSNSEVASVDAKGKITALAEGTATITATPVNGLPAATMTVTVKDDKAETYWSEDFEGEKTLPDRGFEEHKVDWGNNWVLANDPKNADNQVMLLNKVPSGGKNLKHIVFTEAVKQAVLEYKVYYTDGAKTFYLPTFQNNQTSGIYAAYLVLEGDGDLRQNSDSNTIFTNLSKDTWHTIKLVADAVAGKWYLFVDGAYIPVAANTLAGTGLVGMISGTPSTANTINVYFDDFAIYELIPATGMTVKETAVALEAGQSQKLTVSYGPATTAMTAATFASANQEIATVDANGLITAVAEGETTVTVTPVQPGLAAVTVKVTVTGKTPDSYIQDFDDVAVGTTKPEMQIINNMGSNGTVAIIADPEDTDNHILTLSKSIAKGDVQFRIKSGTFAAADKLVLEYKIKTTENATFYPFTLRTAKDDSVRLVISGGYLQYQNMSNTNVVLTQLSNGKWHTVKLVVDTVENAWYIYLDGSYIPVEDNTLRSAEDVTWALTRSTGSNLLSSVYYDDISITPYVEGQGVSSQAEVTVNANVPTKLELVFDPANTSLNSADFTSSDPSVLTVDSNGYVTGLKAGSAVVTVDPHQKGLENLQVLVTVNVIDVTRIEIQPDELSLPVGGHTYLSVVTTPADASFTDVIFASSDASIATVDEYGEIVALKAGTVTLTATDSAYPTVSDSITLTVTDPTIMDTIYVAPTGKADAAGTEADPVNLQGALALIAAKNDNMTGNILVVLADGYYLLNETLHITDAHSGTNNYSVIWRAAQGAEPVIGSAYTVEGSWTKDEATGIYSVDVPAELDSRQLFVNNVRATRARSQGGLLNCSFLMEGSKEIGYISKNVELASYAMITDLELVFKEEWTQPRVGVSSIQDNGNGTVNIVLDQPGFGYIQAKGQTKAKGEGPVWIENALELLDQPGEWYLDTTNDKLYYMPRAWENMDNVTVTLPAMDQETDGALVQIAGSGYNSQVQNIHFEGITFADTTWLRPNSDHGHADVQNNHIREGKDILQPAAVVVKKANSVWFTGCTFTSLGITGLQMLDGVQNSFIIGNHFFDISGSAINVGDPAISADNAYAQGNAMMKNNDILNNYIHAIGVDYGSAAAISVGFAADMDMNHNEIFDIPYSGWHIGYGWNNRFPNNNKNMLLEYNFLHDYMGKGIYDGGGIYILGNTSGDGYNLARYNYFRNQMAAHGAMYPDQGATYFEFIENVVDFSEVKSWHSGLAPRWMLTNQVTEHIHFLNNYTTTSSYKINEQVDQAKDDVTVSGTVVDPTAKWEGTNAQTIMAQAGLESAYASLRNGQAERILVNVPQSGLEMEKNATFELSVSFTDGKDKAVSGGNVILAYDVVDPSIATVSDSGVITSIKSGITTVRIWVVSNNIQTVVERDIIVAETFEDIELAGVTDALTMSKDAEGKTIVASIITSLGRKLTPDSVSAVIADEKVAVVEDGVVKPVTTGATRLTVTAVLDGESIVKVFKVIITEKTEGEEDNLWEIFDKEKEDTWVKPGANTWSLVDDTSITTKLNGFATFSGAEYSNELLSFRLKIDKSTGGGGWPAIVLRAQTAETYVAGGANGYILCLGTGGIELFRFTDGVRHVFYGDFEAGSGVDVSQKIGGKLQDSAWTWNGDVAEHDIQVGTVADGDDVRVILIVDGVEVINCLDKADHGALSNSGYFGLVGRSETWTLTKNQTISDEEPVASVGEKKFATLKEALEAAVAGETVTLLADAEVDQLVLTSGVKLDLNGYDLTADYIVAFDGNAIVDSASGVGLIKCTHVRLAKNNEQMPVWDEAAGGYRLFGMRSSQMFLSQSADKFEFLAKPLLGNKANSVFMSQAETNGLTFKVRMSWTNASGNEVHQDFTLKGEDLKTIYSQANQVVSLKVSGAGSYVNRLQVSCYILSQTGVEWLSAPDLFVGQ